MSSRISVSPHTLLSTPQEQEQDKCSGGTDGENKQPFAHVFGLLMRRDLINLPAIKFLLAPISASQEPQQQQHFLARTSSGRGIFPMGKRAVLPLPPVSDIRNLLQRGDSTGLLDKAQSPIPTACLPHFPLCASSSIPSLCRMELGDFPPSPCSSHFRCCCSTFWVFFFNHDLTSM